MGSFLFIINTDGDFYYDLFYLGAFLVGYLVLLQIGWKRQYNLATWLLLLAATRFFFIVGTKLFSYSGQEWQIIFTDYYLPPTTGKTLLGGLLLVTAIFYFLKQLLHLKTAVLDAFAFIIPLSIAIQRPGCLLAGCCYGKVTSVPWAVEYLPGTLPHFHQFGAGLIQAQELTSLPVHPTQLYEALNGLLVVLILLGIKRYIKAPGNLFAAALGLYSFFRFFIEFFRSPLAHTAGGQLIGDLKGVQWGLLVAVTILGLVFWYREKYYKPGLPTPSPVPAMPILVTLLFGLVMGTWLLRDWFMYTELLALNMALFPAIGAVGVYLFRNIFVPQYRWLAVGMLVLPVFLMSQTVPVGKIKTRPDSTLNSYQTFKVGLGGGEYQNSYTIGHGSGCDRVSNTKYFKQEYTVGGAGYAYTQRRAKEERTYGVNGYVGKHQETDITNGAGGTSRDNLILGFNPYVRLEKKYYGLTAGLHVGSLWYTFGDRQEDGYNIPDWGSKSMKFYPQFSARVGPTHIIFSEFHLANQFPSPFPGARIQAGIGSGFGIKNGSYLRVGVTEHDGYIGGNLVLKDKLVLEPLLILSERSYYRMKGAPMQFSLGLNYRFNHK